MLCPHGLEFRAKSKHLENWNITQYKFYVNLINLNETQWPIHTHVILSQLKKKMYLLHSWVVHNWSRWCCCCCFIIIFLVIVFYVCPKIESLKVDLGKKDAELVAAETKLETLKAHQANQQEHISVLQTSLSAKEHHIKNLQSEVRCVFCWSICFNIILIDIPIDVHYICSVSMTLLCISLFQPLSVYGWI